MAPKTYTQRTQMVEDKQGGCLGRSVKIALVVALILVVIALLA